MWDIEGEFGKAEILPALSVVALVIRAGYKQAGLFGAEMSGRIGDWRNTRLILCGIEKKIALRSKPVIALLTGQ